MSDFLFFFRKFCDVDEVVIIHKLILAKFGYQQNLKEENLNILLCFWLPY